MYIYFILKANSLKAFIFIAPSTQNIKEEDNNSTIYIYIYIICESKKNRENDSLAIEKGSKQNEWMVDLASTNRA